MDTKIQENSKQDITKIAKNFSTSLVPQNVQEASQMALILSKSNIIPRDFQNKPESCFVAIGMGMELGLPPLQAIQNIMVVNGRPTLWGDAVLALVKGSDKCEYISETIEGGVAKCVAKRRGDPEPVIRTFSLEDAKKAGLLNKPGPWSQYQSRMLQMRARSWALRDCFPDLLKGVGVREEVQDYDTPKVVEAVSINEILKPDQIKVPDGSIKSDIPSDPFPAPPPKKEIKARGELTQLSKIKKRFLSLGVKESAYKDYVNGLALEDTDSLVGHLTDLGKAIVAKEKTIDEIFQG